MHYTEGDPVFSPDRRELYWSSGDLGGVYVIDVRLRRVMSTTIRPSPLVAKLRGIGPRGMVVSADGSRLYVAEMGLNVIGVIDTRTGTVLGHIPMAWYPYRVALSNDGKKLFSVCFRGFGFGPRGIANLPDDPFIGTDNANGQGVLNILRYHLLPRAGRECGSEPVEYDISMPWSGSVSAFSHRIPHPANRRFLQVEGAVRDCLNGPLPEGNTPSLQNGSGKGADETTALAPRSKGHLGSMMRGCRYGVTVSCVVT